MRRRLRPRGPVQQRGNPALRPPPVRENRLQPGETCHVAADAHRLGRQRRQRLRLGHDRDPARRHPRRPGRGRARVPAAAAAPLHRYRQLLPVLEPGPGPAGQADLRRGRQMENRGRSPAVQAGQRAGQRPGHYLDLLAPLDRDLPARLYLPRRGRRLPARPRRRRRHPRDDPHHHPRAAATAPRHRHPRTPPRPRPP